MTGLRVELAPESHGAAAMPPLELVEPWVVYEPLAGDERAGADGASNPASWRRSGTSRWQWEDGRCSLALQNAPVADGMVVWFGIEARRPVRLRHAAVVLEASCDEPPMVLDRELRWRPLEDELLLTGMTPLVARWRHGGRAYELRPARAGVIARLSWKGGWGGRLQVAVYLDAAALHPSWSFADQRTTCTSAPVREAGWRLDTGIRVRLLEDGGAHQPVAAGRLPAGAEAAFVITDHSDFDSVERLRAFLYGKRGNGGWAERGLRFTKGVFTLPSTPLAPRVPAPSLATPGYLSLLHRLHDDGSEIAPHGVNESGNIPPDDFRAALARLAEAFAPRTWIDHGMTLRYCYTMGGAENEYDLLGELRRNGIMALWSYNDIPATPEGSLNMLVAARRELLTTTGRTIRHAGTGEPLVAAHYVRSLLRSRLRGSMGDALMGAMSGARRAYMMRRAANGSGGTLRPIVAAVRSLGPGGSAWSSRSGQSSGDAARRPYDRAAEFEMAGIVYPERLVPVTDARCDDLMLFSTVEVVHTRDAYTPHAVQRLVRERGLHISHCYLLNRLPYIAGVFDGNDDGPGADWARFVSSLEREVRAGTLWNPPVGELAAWMRAWQGVELAVSRGAVELRDTFGDGVRDFTLLLSPEVRAADIRWGEGRPAGYRRWPDWLAVWGAVPAGGSVVVRWM